MTELIVDRKSVQEHILRLIKTEKIVLREVDGEIHLAPIKQNNDCTVGLRGMLADYDEMSVDKFLERSRRDKELDL